MMNIAMYGIPNCDTVKKARVWLGKQGLACTFHDYKKDGASSEKIAAWIAAAGLEVIVNRKGTTFRALAEEDKIRAAHSHTAVALLVQRPSIIKRPIAEHDGGILVGFKEDEWSAALL